MSNDAHPWRDIYSVAAWNKIMEKAPDRGNYTMLTTLIGTYHALPKAAANATAFEQRTAALDEIAQEVKRLLKGEPSRAKAPGTSPKSLADTTDISRWLESLWRRCRKKRLYLEEMMKFYNGHGWSASPEASPARFMQHLNDFDKKRTIDAGYMRLTAQNSLERIDPYHRSAEISFVESGPDAVAVNPSTLPMSKALCTWLLDNSSLTVPFYVWLEGHPLCTTTPGLDDSFDPEFKSRVIGTRYLKQEELPVHSVQIRNGILVRETADGEVPLDTMRSCSKGFVGAHAFVYTRSREFYSAQHGAPDEGLAPMHHSSFTQGRKVHSAGMWYVKAGKILKLNNSTGHYRTDAPQLRELVTMLRSADVLAPDAKIVDVLRQTGDQAIDEWLKTPPSTHEPYRHKEIKPPSALHAGNSSNPIATRPVPKMNMPAKFLGTGKK